MNLTEKNGIHLLNCWLILEEFWLRISLNIKNTQSIKSTVHTKITPVSKTVMRIQNDILFGPGLEMDFLYAGSGLHPASEFASNYFIKLRSNLFHTPSY